MTQYWLGVLTTPALVLLLAALFVGWVRTIDALARRGITFAIYGRREVESISEHTLRRDIWWERPRGPLFTGGWYHQYPVWEEPDRARVNRWVGLGSPDGPCVIAYHSCDLGEVT